MHANGIADIPARLEALGALGGLSRDALTAQAAAGLDIAVQLDRDHRGRRRVVEVGWVTRAAHGLEVRPVWTVTGGLGAGADDLIDRLRRQPAAALPELLRR